MRDPVFARHALFAVLVTAATAGALVLVAYAYQAFLVLFCGVLVGVLVDTAARGLAALLPISRRGAARLVLIVAGVGLCVGAWFGLPLLGEQLERMARELPTFVATARDTLAEKPWGERLLASLPSSEELLRQLDVERMAKRAGTNLAGGAAAVVLVLLVGIWLGLAPRRHMSAVIDLFPEASRERARTVADTCHRALRLWLLGRLVDMSILATLTSIGLAIVGIPQPVALGILAGLFEFVPYVGPFLAFAPIGLTALAVAPDLVVHAVVLYGGLQLAQSYVITPLVEQKAVQVPPAVGISAQVIATAIAGPLGLVVATPIVVITVVLVQSLWIEDTMHEDVQVLGAT